MYAKPLRFLDFLLVEAIPAAVPYRYGVLVNVPQPARYAVHKLIVAPRRAQTAAAKARKDIEQAMALITCWLKISPTRWRLLMRRPGTAGNNGAGH